MKTRVEQSADPLEEIKNGEFPEPKLPFTEHAAAVAKRWLENQEETEA